MDETERRLQAVVDDAQREIDECNREMRRTSDPDVIAQLRRRLGQAARRKRTAQGALDKYQRDKRRRRR